MAEKRVGVVRGRHSGEAEGSSCGFELLLLRTLVPDRSMIVLDLPLRYAYQGTGDGWERPDRSLISDLCVRMSIWYLALTEVASSSAVQFGGPCLLESLLHLMQSTQSMRFIDSKQLGQ